jgi:hypothetical protein
VALGAPAQSVGPRPLLFLPLFTNVVEQEFSEVHTQEPHSPGPMLNGILMYRIEDSRAVVHKKPIIPQASLMAPL